MTNNETASSFLRSIGNLIDRRYGRGAVCEECQYEEAKERGEVIGVPLGMESVS